MSVQARPEVAEPVAGRPARRVQRLDRRRRGVWQAVAVGVTIFLVGSAVVLLMRVGRHTASVARPTAPQQTVAWSVEVGGRSFVAVVGAGGARAPTVLSIPAATLVDLPGGGPDTVGEAATSPGVLMASIQAELNRRIDHYLVSQAIDLKRLIDRLGGAEIQVERAFDYGGRTVGPGPQRLGGAQAVAYLAAGANLDRDARWEGVLTGVFAGTRVDRGAFGAGLGKSDDAPVVSRVLAGAHGARVLELPTAPAVGGGVAADAKAVAALLRSRFAAAPPLIRIVVLNGNGRPGMGIRVASLLSPHGYRVIASQNARSFSAKVTKVVASESAFLGQAERVKDLLGVGKVYVGIIPSGSADVTILVGRDFK
jgi:hypothetical protein